jgi:hypothetical protein
MPAQKTHDIVCKVGEYQDRRTGETKSRWLNVGSLMRNDDGGVFMMLDRTFNPAGVPNPDGRSNVLLSCFVPREQRQGSGGQGGGQEQPTQNGATANSGYDDEIPF